MKSIEILQVGRAVAALAVVLHHALLATEDFVGEVPTWIVAIASRGYLGVDFFFVLSGFIIYYSTIGKNGKPSIGIASFAEKRLTRIYLPYLPIGIGLALAYVLLPELSASTRQWSWWATLTLMPSFQEPALSVAWTLQHEMVFYMLFGLALLLGRVTQVMALWSAVILLMLVLDVDISGPAAFLLDPINLEFGFGMVAAMIFIHRPDWRSARPFVLLSGLAMGVFVVTGYERKDSFLFGLSLAAILVPLCRTEISSNWKFGRLALLLGSASYAIYLIHNPLMSLIARLPFTHWANAMALMCVTAIVAGVVYHLACERPVLAFVRKSNKRWSKNSMPPSPSD